MCASRKKMVSRQDLYQVATSMGKVHVIEGEMILEMDNIPLNVMLSEILKSEADSFQNVEKETTQSSKDILDIMKFFNYNMPRFVVEQAYFDNQCDFVQTIDSLNK